MQEEGKYMSKRIYCVAQFTPKENQFNTLFKLLKSLEADTLREEGCVSYRVTKQIQNTFASGESMPIVFHEIWTSVEAFERHCQREAISHFFEKECLDSNGLVEAYNVSVYSDE